MPDPLYRCLIAASPSTTEATTATAISSTSTTGRGITARLLKLSRHLLLRVTEELDEIFSVLRVVARKERDGGTLGTGTSSSSDTMDIILDIVGEIEVDDKLHILHICCTKIQNKEMLVVAVVSYY